MKLKCLSDSKKSICLFLLVFISYSLIYMTKNCYSAAMADIVKDGVMTKSQTGLISACFYLVYAVFQVVGGIAADRFEPHKLVLIGYIGAGIANILIYFIHDYIAMIVIWSLNAVIQFGVWPGIFKIVASQLMPEHRIKGIFYISFTTATGLLFSYFTAAFIRKWENNFLISAILMFVTSVVFIIVYNSLEKHMETQDENVISREEQSDIQEKKYSVLSLFIKAGVPWLLVVNIIINVLNLGVKALVPVMIMESYTSITPAVANGLNILLVLATPVGLFLSRLSFFRTVSAPKAMSFFVMCAVPFLFAITFIGKIPVAVAIICLTLLMVVIGAVPIFFTYISNSFSKFGCNATLIGLFNAMSALGIVIANYVFARIADEFGWGVTTKGWLVVTLVSLVLLFIVIPIWQRFVKKMELD